MHGGLRWLQTRLQSCRWYVTRRCYQADADSRRDQSLATTKPASAKVSLAGFGYHTACRRLSWIAHQFCLAWISISFWHETQNVIVKIYLVRTISDHLKQRFKSSTTMACPAGILPSSAKNLPLTILSWMSWSWLRKPCTSAAGNWSCYELVNHQGKEHSTLGLVFAADIERRTDISLSWIGVSSGDKSARAACKSARMFRQVSSRFSNKVNKCGEYVSFPRLRVSRIVSKVWLTESRSFAE